MTHYVLFKFEEGYFNNRVVDRAIETYSKLIDVIPNDISDVAIQKNCVERDVNFDLMISAEVSSEEALGRYLTHPVHQELVAEWVPHLVLRGSFDVQ